MKKYLKIILWTIPILGLVGAFVSMFYLPDVIPIQINLTGKYSNFGSKFILLVIPIISIILVISHNSPKGRYSKTSPYLILFFELILIGVEIFAISMGLNYK